LIRRKKKANRIAGRISEEGEQRKPSGLRDEGSCRLKKKQLQKGPGRSLNTGTSPMTEGEIECQDQGPDGGLVGKATGETLAPGRKKSGKGIVTERASGFHPGRR